MQCILNTKYIIFIPPQSVENTTLYLSGTSHMLHGYNTIFNNFISSCFFFFLLYFLCLCVLIFKEFEFIFLDMCETRTTVRKHFCLSASFFLLHPKFGSNPEMAQKLGIDSQQIHVKVMNNFCTKTNRQKNQC